MNLSKVVFLKETFEKLTQYCYFPVGQQLKLMKALREVEKQYTYYQSCNNNLIKKHGMEKTKGTGDYFVSKQNPLQWKMYMEELEELLNTEIDIDFKDIGSINIRQIEKIEDELQVSKKIALSAKEWMILGEIIEIVEE